MALQIETEELNIYQKLAKIGKPAEFIKKNKKGFGYTYTSEDEILSKIKGLMEKYHVSLIPSIVPATTRVLPYHYIKTKTDKAGKPYEEHVNEIIVQGDMCWTWINNDNPTEKIDVPWVFAGQQSDTSQAFGSGLTYSSRYFMLKYFNISTSDDDPDNFMRKKKEAEQYEETEVIRGIGENLLEFINAHLKKSPDDRDDITVIVKKYAPNGDFFKIKDVKQMTQLYEEVTKKYTPKQTKKSSGKADKKEGDNNGTQT